MFLCFWQMIYAEYFVGLERCQWAVQKICCLLQKVEDNFQQTEETEETQWSKLQSHEHWPLTARAAFFGNSRFQQKLWATKIQFLIAWPHDRSVFQVVKDSLHFYPFDNIQKCQNGGGLSSWRKRAAMRTCIYSGNPFLSPALFKDLEILQEICVKQCLKRCSKICVAVQCLHLFCSRGAFICRCKSLAFVFLFWIKCIVWVALSCIVLILELWFGASIVTMWLGLIENLK